MKGCPNYLKKNESMSHSLLVKSCLVMDSTNSWWIDFEATNHIYNFFIGVSTKNKAKLGRNVLDSRICCEDNCTCNGRCYPSIRE